MVLIRKPENRNQGVNLPRESSADAWIPRTRSKKSNLFQKSKLAKSFLVSNSYRGPGLVFLRFENLLSSLVMYALRCLTWNVSLMLSSSGGVTV